MNRSWQHGILTALIATSLLLAACGLREQPQPKRLTLATPPSPSLAPVYVAQAEGYFEALGLDLEIQPRGVGVAAMASLLDGEVDIAAVADPPIARAALRGEDPVAITVFDRVQGLSHIVARRDSGIEQPTDLAGKRIGIIKDNIGEYFLHVYLVTSGVDPASVRIVELESGEMVSAILDGDVDAISWAPPSTYEAQQGLGDNAVLLQRPGLYSVTWYIVTRPEVRERDAEALELFLEAIDRANSFIEENPEEARAITAERAGLPLAVVEETWDDHEFVLTLDQAMILQLQDIANWMLDGEDPPSFLPHVDTGPLSSVRPQGVTVVEPENDR